MVVSRGPSHVRSSAHHDTKAQAQRRGKECMAILDSKVFHPWEQADHAINIDDAGTQDASWPFALVATRPGASDSIKLTDAAHTCHYPSSAVIVEDHDDEFVANEPLAQRRGHWLQFCNERMTREPMRVKKTFTGLPTSVCRHTDAGSGGQSRRRMTLVVTVLRGA